MQVKVSVIIPFFNAANYIANCVHCLFGQTLSETEFIFVNDCSTDDSLIILENTIAIYFHRGRTVKIINHAENKGAATARNSGLAHASGECIGWLDSDDWIDTHLFEEMYSKLIQDEADIVWCDFYNTYHDREDYIRQEYSAKSHDCIKGLIKGDLMGGLCNKLVRRSVFTDHQIQFPDGMNMCEDLRVSVQLFYYAKRVSYLHAAYYHYVKYRADSISSSRVGSDQADQGWIENVKGIAAFVASKSDLALSEEIQLLKLRPKKNLLVNGTTVAAYKTWRGIFPEANDFIWKTQLPAHYKVLAWCANHKLWAPISLALWAKGWIR
ncbi:glycosyltransferase family 2 protein [Sphingobacterium ginsenosidimutans]|uniref:Glycosyltransferase family 2 protein n=1 Tax=Sphingobacterium ginsenosidimutans TaxID=687845 RepID=A0ABP7ZQN0_9SPHI